MVKTLLPRRKAIARVEEQLAARSVHAALLNRSSSSTARRYRTVQIHAGDRLLTAADPIPDDLQLN